MGWLYLSGKGLIYMGKGKRNNMDGETGMLRIDSALIIGKTNRRDFSPLSWPYLPNVLGDSLTEETILP